MPKKLESARGHASDKAHSPLKDRTRKPGQGEASYDEGNQQKKNRKINPTSGIKNAFDDVEKPKRESDSVFTDMKKMSGGKRSKDGCFPKFMMLFLSIVAGAVYFILGS